jgi:site-specific recombinase XerD
LLKAAGGDEFAARRDRAILRMLFDAGIRRAELAGLTLDSINLREQYVTVLGKGRRIRTVPYGANTAESLDDYLRVRMRHRDHKLPALWLAASPHRGAFGYDGIHQMIQRIARRAGIPDAYAHRFRHTAVHTQLDGGMSEGEAMRIFGWNSPSMPRHYGSALAHARAMAAARRISHADRI